MQVNKIENIDALTFLKSLPDKSCDIFTDPPYNVGKNYGPMIDDNRPDYIEWITTILLECKRAANSFTVYVPKKWNLLYWNVLGTDFNEIILTYRASGAIRYGFSNQFHKLLTNSRPVGKPILNVWENLPQPGQGFFFKEKTYGHPGYTSEAITDKVIQELCKSEIICDPFMGTGTTAVSTLKVGKSFVGSELNPEYISIANNRIKLRRYSDVNF